MKLLIDISKDLYNATVNGLDANAIWALRMAIVDGVKLPSKRLMILSEDAVKRELERLSFSRQKWISEVGLSNATVAIIEPKQPDRDDAEIEAFIKNNYEPVAGEPGYVWISKRNFQMISIETLAKSMKSWLRIKSAESEE